MVLFCYMALFKTQLENNKYVFNVSHSWVVYFDVLRGFHLIVNIRQKYTWHKNSSEITGTNISPEKKKLNKTISFSCSSMNIAYLFTQSLHIAQTFRTGQIEWMKCPWGRNKLHEIPYLARCIVRRSIVQIYRLIYLKWGRHHRFILRWVSCFSPMMKTKIEWIF